MAGRGGGAACCEDRPLRPRPRPRPRPRRRRPPCCSCLRLGALLLLRVAAAEEPKVGASGLEVCANRLQDAAVITKAHEMGWGYLHKGLSVVRWVGLPSPRLLV